MNKKILGLLLSFMSAMPVAASQYWPWDKIDTEELSFPADFDFGAGHSHLQYEGRRKNHRWNTDYNNWHLLEDRDIDGARHENIQDLCGDACDGWNRALDDVDLVYDINLNVYRMSVSWEKIYPKQNEIDQEALDHYIAVLDKCNQYGIKVLMGLHHYTDPVWFTKLGGWTKRENIKHFVDFAQTVYQAFGDRVWLWATFNSPSGYAAKCFLTGEMIPSINEKNQIVIKKKDFAGHANMLCNLCLAHVEVYAALKQEFEAQKNAGCCNKEPQIGLLKNILQMETDSLDVIGKIGRIAKGRLLDTPMYEFFTTGVYPSYSFFNLVCNSNPLAQDERAPQSFDFIGLNYYSHMKFNGAKVENCPQEIKTQNKNYTIYPEGLYYALETIDKEMVTPISIIQGKNIPLYVTENGIAAVDAEKDRELFFKRYLYAIKKAISRGIEVKGYITWSLMDNYEWGSYSKKYGLYHVEFDKSSPDQFKRTLKTDAGTQYFLDVVKNTRTA